MPTDEQPATHFYGYYISFDATGVEPVDRVLKAVADAGRGSHRTENWAELGLEAEIQRAAHEAAAVFQARDAEVQRLVAALTSMVVKFDPNSENEIAAHQNAVMLLAEYLPEKEVADAD